jgi:hypothetical protein
MAGEMHGEMTFENPISELLEDDDDDEVISPTHGKGKSRIPNPLKLGKRLGKGVMAAGASGVSGGIGAVGGGASFLKGGNFQRKVKKNYSPEETAQRALWRGLLEKLDLLKGLPEEIEYAINALEVSDPVRAGDDVFRIGQKGDCIYFLMEGTCEARIDGQVRSLFVASRMQRFAAVSETGRVRGARWSKPTR